MSDIPQFSLLLQKNSIMGGDKGYRAAYNDFRTQFFTVEGLLDEMKCGHLAKLPSPMWSESPWSLEKKSRYIETLLVGQPQISLFVDGSLPVWNVLAGSGELKTIYEYVSGQFRLESLYFYMGQYDCRYFNELPLLVQRKILNYRFLVHILNPGVSSSVRYGIYTTLIGGPEYRVKDYVRSIIYPRNYELLARACDTSRGIFKENGFYTLENLAGHLLVYLSFRQNKFSELHKVETDALDLLTNFLLRPENDLAGCLSRTKLDFHLPKALLKITGDYPKNIFDMDVLIANAVSDVSESVSADSVQSILGVTGAGRPCLGELLRRIDDLQKGMQK